MVVLLLVLVSLLLFVLATRCRRGYHDLSGLQGWGYAHRGLHGHGVPENSLRAFELAADAGYGVELDVHLLADGELAVIHDAKLWRTTGKDGVVEDLKISDLEQCFLEDTDQTIPDFKQVLKLIDGRIPLIIELKCERNNYATLCHTVCSALEDYDGIYCLESFDPRCIRWLRINRPGIIRGQLTENYFRSSKTKLPIVLRFLLANQLLNFLTLPDFIAYRYSDRHCVSNFMTEKIWKAQSVTWTIQSRDEYNIALEEGRIPIFEGFCP